MPTNNLQQAWSDLDTSERRQLAKRIGLSVGYLSQICNGHRVLQGAALDDTRRSSAKWPRLLRALGIDPSQVDLTVTPQPIGRRKGDQPVRQAA